MDPSLFELLICPKCQGPIRLTAFEPRKELTDYSQNGHTQAEVSDAILTCCGCHIIYPVIEGVPRFLEGGIDQFPEFFQEHEGAIKSLSPSRHLPQSSGETRKPTDYDNIRQSFSQEWSIFDYETDKTWGWTLEDRKTVFLGDVGIKPEQLRGKKMLDAGCGNGTMTAVLSDFGLEIVGLDLNDGLGRAYANRGRYSESAVRNVQYVQGNLVSPPLKEDIFDLIYSSGVIHHTPSSKKTFESLVRMTKRGGRLYVWVYGKRGWPVRVFFATGRSLKHWLSLRSVMWICRLLAPFYKVAATFINKLGSMQFRSRTSREITLDLFDAFAPRYNHWHSEAEVRGWFEEHGFQNIHVSGVQKHGFGMYGDKI